MLVRRTASGIAITECATMPGTDLRDGRARDGRAALPDRASRREAARRMASSNNLKQIGLAMINYEQANKTFPPAYKADKDGKPLLSWRVLILPYLESNSLYEQFHLDEPWDSAHKRLIAQMPAVLQASQQHGCRPVEDELSDRSRREDDFLREGRDGGQQNHRRHLEHDHDGRGRRREGRHLDKTGRL